MSETLPETPAAAEQKQYKTSERMGRRMQRKASDDDEIRFASLHCSIAIRRPAPGVVVVLFEGRDTGELGDAPFRELEKDLAAGAPIELFIDARGGKAASLDVSGAWAHWLAKNRDRLRHVSMLTGSRFIQLSADFVRKFADLGEVMRIYTDPASFEGALGNAVGRG
jgi:hypothetical protein